MSTVVRVNDLNPDSVLPSGERPVVIVTDDGLEIATDANLPPDVTWRIALADWLAAGGVIEPFAPPS